MAFTMTELQQELQALGYGDLPDEFIVSSLSQLQFHIIPPSSNGDKDRTNSGRVRSKGKPSSRRVHGSPVPGDRDFVAESMRSALEKKKEAGSSTFKGGGLDSVCFTSDFATELDEMRKMLKIMHGTKENLFGSGSGGSAESFPTQRTGRKPFGLADEHEAYVGNLRDQWRAVGRALRSKRKEIYPVQVGTAEPHQTKSALNSENRRHREKQSDDPVEGKFQPTAVEPCTASGDLERNDTSRVTEESMMGGRQINNGSNEGDLHTLGKGVTEICTTGPAFKRQESSSAISPKVSYQPGGMLYPENFTADDYQKDQSDDLLRTDEGNTLLSSHQDTEERDLVRSPSSPRSFPSQTPKAVLQMVSGHSKDQFLAAFQKSLDDMDPKDCIDQETFANVTQRISGTITSKHIDNTSRLIPVESENPFEMSVPVFRTPDRRADGGGRPGYQSPLNDRSNMRFAEEDPEIPQYSPSGKANKKKEWDSSVTSPAKRNSAVTLKRSRSSRGVSRRNEIVEEANIAYNVEGQQGDSHHPYDNPTTTPPSSAARKLKTSDKALRHSLSEKSTINPRITLRHKGGIYDAASQSDLDIYSLGLSPIKLREQPASPGNLSCRERACAVNGYHEHRSCSVCNPTALRKSGDSNNSQSSTSGSKISETVASESEVSPQQKRSSVKTEAAGSLLKQKSSLKNSSAPSGIYTPLDPKKNELSTSKVLLKTRRIASSMDFASDTSKVAIDRRAPSLRSSTESSRSSGPQRGTSQSQFSKSNSGSSPLTKSSTFSSYSSRSATPKEILTSPFEKSPSIASRSSATPKGTLTPGGPRRGGKVDRVARVLDDMRPSTASPPFVVPTLNNNSEGVYIF